jgi:alpha-tubulin suppressor-like RCC1 family protein
MGGKSMRLRYFWLWIVIGALTLISLPASGAAAPSKSVIVLGGTHVLALKENGSLWVWGYNWDGQLGLSDTDNRSSPVQMGTGYVAVAAGTNHSLGIKADGSLWAWGQNYDGQLGQGYYDYTPHPNPMQVGGETDWVAVAGGEHHSLALKADGSLWAWGDNFYGELGLGNTTDQFTPTRVGTGYAAVAAGGDYSLALMADGSIRSWGRNDYGQLGQDSADNDPHPTPTQIEADTNWVAVCAGTNHSLGVKANGSLWAWGSNEYGQLGLVDTADQHIPAQVGTGYKAVTAGGNYSLGLKTDGSLWAWGRNNLGQLGLGNTDDQQTPVQAGTGYVALAACGSYSKGGMGVKNNHSLWTWGFNSQGQLGLGYTSAYEDSPLQVPGFTFPVASLPFLPILLGN